MFAESERIEGGRHYFAIHAIRKGGRVECAGIYM